MTRIRSTGAMFAAGMLIAAASAHAQQDRTVRIDEHWRAYLGCWATSTATVPVGPMVCVVPTSNAQTVEFVTVDGDSVISTTPFTASGSRVELTRNGCSGWESARWSIDERRLFSQAEYTCADGSKQQQQSIISMRYADTFTRIDGIRSGKGYLARVMHFQVIMDSSVVPPAVASRIPSMTQMPSFNARLQAAAELSTADIVDASKALESPIVEAWLADRNQRVSANVNDLRAMKASGVPEGVIDMVVAIANPQYFTLAQNGAPTTRPTDPFDRRNANGMNLTRAELERLRLERQYGAFGGRFVGPLDWWDPYSGWSNYGYGTYNRFGGIYGGYPQYWGFPQYGGNGGGWVSGAPIVIVPTTPPEPPGRVINGSGYSQGGVSTGRGAEPRSPSVGSWDSGSSGSGGGVSTSSGGSGGGGNAPSSPPSGGGEQRTAKPRP